MTRYLSVLERSLQGVISTSELWNPHWTSRELLVQKCEVAFWKTAFQPTRSLQPRSKGLQPNSDGPQPTRDGLQPKSDGLQLNIFERHFSKGSSHHFSPSLPCYIGFCIKKSIDHTGSAGSRLRASHLVWRAFQTHWSAEELEQRPDLPYHPNHCRPRRCLKVFGVVTSRTCPKYTKIKESMTD